MSRLGSLYIESGEPDGPLTGGTCEVDDWAAAEIERLRAELTVATRKAMRETKLLVIQQGEVKLNHRTAYSVVGNDEAVCFTFDVDRRTAVDYWTYSDADCPVICLDGTMVEMVEFPGWRVHATNGGDSVAIALVRWTEL